MSGDDVLMEEEEEEEEIWVVKRESETGERRASQGGRWRVFAAWMFDAMHI